ncbi:hypothetical protein [Chryseobacterium indologenes]|uniref:hypothetical protein n=1 Tax=Chryseobacterium indologenes TaxID=253 RepID=UPI0009A1E2B4|nr:hypothetical protein [Chryseobacterium indologenes]
MEDYSALQEELELPFPEELKKLLTHKNLSEISLRAYEKDNEGSFIFTFSLTVTNNGLYDYHFWKLICEKNKRVKITPDELELHFSYYKEHFLLSEFREGVTELYFRKKSQNPDKLVSELYALHKKTFEDLFAIEKFLHADLNAVCHYAGGRFAEGPVSILKHYYALLEKHNMEPYYYQSEGEKRRGEERAEFFKDYKLVILGNTYCIGENFTFEKDESGKFKK